MDRYALKRAVLALALFVVAALTISGRFGNTARADGPSQQQQQANAQPAAMAQPEDKPVEQTHKNIQALKGLPDSQLIPVMQLFSAALGVKCDACHVRTPDNKFEFDKDDKKAKQTARKMIQMTIDINKANFEGRNEVSCFACHRGGEHPVAVPPLPLPVETRAEGPAPQQPMPVPQQIVAKYVQAVGGREAAQKIKSRVIKGSIVIADGTSLPMELTYEGPDRMRSVVTTKQGESVQAFDGAAGWIKTDRETRPLNPYELDRLKTLALSLEPIQIKEPLPRILYGGKEKIGEHEAYRLRMTTPDKKRVVFYFDTQSGLLLRRLILRDTIVGADPELVDYDDYRDVEGVKLPFSIKVSYTSNNISGTRKIADLKTNVPVDASKFAIPRLGSGSR
ncbi:MAG TPA: c-type cytochrome [Blastocatellia bacterium]|nr:c-type cytochrome [Blastocatellia bacterium]